MTVNLFSKLKIKTLEGPIIESRFIGIVECDI